MQTVANRKSGCMFAVGRSATTLEEPLDKYNFVSSHRESEI